MTFVHCTDGDRIVDGRRYRKVAYERYGAVKGCDKISDLPSEEHYLVHRSKIEKVFAAKMAFSKLTERERKFCFELIVRFEEHCGIPRDRHGLGGSSALGCRTGKSDFDWIIYDDEAVEKVLGYMRRSPEYFPCWTFSEEHIRKKYALITDLPMPEVLHLFALKRSRMKYFRYRDQLVSLSFVSAQKPADQFLSEIRSGTLDLCTGVVVDAKSIHGVPQILPIRTNRNNRVEKVLSWLFLYSGAFQNGDSVEVLGERVAIANEHFIIVDRKQHYIRLLSGRGPGADSPSLSPSSTQG
jgi:predicted nucleotidyltransferase